MQPSRMFSQGTMQNVELMREVSAMRLTQQALEATPRGDRYAALGSLAFRFASWRRLSTLSFHRRRRDIVVMPTRTQGA